jgi:hypothetical protein
MFFNTLTLHGTGGRVLWHHQTAAAVRAWTIYHPKKGQWTLSAQLERSDPICIRQKPLMFTAPRAGGFWCWPLLTDTIRRSDARLTATLGPPEQ